MDPCQLNTQGRYDQMLSYFISFYFLLKILQNVFSIIPSSIEFITLLFFQIDIPEIGEVYKIRISINEDASWQPDWFLDKVSMEHLATKQILTFPCNRYCFF